MYNVLKEERADCFNIIESKRDSFFVYYTDDRGNKDYKTELYTIEDACDFLFELAKNLSYNQF